MTIFVGGSTSLADDADHVEWLSGRRHEIDWRFWERYRRWLGDVSGLPPQAVQRLDEITDDVLGAWRTRAPGGRLGPTRAWSSARSSPARPPTTPD